MEKMIPNVLLEREKRSHQLMGTPTPIHFFIDNYFNLGRYDIKDIL